MERGRGIPFIVSGASGSGKTTLCRAAIESIGRAAFSVSTTTRQPRVGELPDVDYHFVDEAEFHRLRQNNAFIEWAKVHGHYYGTLQSEVSERLDAGQDVFLDIDVQGGNQLMSRLSDGVFVFVLPPSREVLESRLRARKSDSDEVIAKRLHLAEQETTEALGYDYWISNDVFEVACRDLLTVVAAEHLRRRDKEALLHKWCNRSGEQTLRTE